MRRFTGKPVRLTRAFRSPFFEVTIFRLRNHTGKMTMPARPHANENLIRRPAAFEDLQEVALLCREVCEAEGDVQNARSAEALQRDWSSPGFSLQHDSCILQEPGGRIVGYAALFDVHNHCKLSADLFIHPHYLHPDAVQSLLDILDRRAGEHIPLAPPGHRVCLQIPLDAHDETGRKSLADAGYVPVRHFWRMGIDLARVPAAAALPAGFEFRPYDEEHHSGPILEARNAAFRDHWGSLPWSADDFSRHVIEKEGYEPGLWSVIWQGEKVAGFSINRSRSDTGWVQIRGVRPAARGLGLGRKLLGDSVYRFQQRGERSVGLVVDASNPTGATRLYRKAGMRGISEYVLCEKELRPGLDPGSLPDS